MTDLSTEQIKTEVEKKADDKNIFHAMWDILHDITNKVSDFAGDIKDKIIWVPKTIWDFFEDKKDTIHDLTKWTLYVGTFKWVLDTGVYAGKKTKQQIELAYGNAMKSLHDKLNDTDRDHKIQEIKEEDISFFSQDGFYFFNDKETWVATKTNLITKEWVPISTEEFEQAKKQNQITE